jgi:hypothetical protein
VVVTPNPESALICQALATMPTGAVVAGGTLAGVVASILGVEADRVSLVSGARGEPRIVLDGELLSVAIKRAEATGWGIAGAAETWVEA